MTYFATRSFNATTGALTFFGNTGIGRSGGIAFTSTGRLYAITTSLWELNPTNASVISSMLLSRFFDGLATVGPMGVILAAVGSSIDLDLYGFNGRGDYARGFYRRSRRLRS